MQYVKKKNIWTWSKKWVADVWNSVNLSMSSLGVFSDECSSFLDIIWNWHWQKAATLYNQG